MLVIQKKKATLTFKHAKLISVSKLFMKFKNLKPKVTPYASDEKV